MDVSDNGGVWVRWLKAAPTSVSGAQASGSAPFFGVAGHTYTFRVSATDGARNTGAASAVQRTTVAAGVPRPMPFTAAYAIAGTGELSALSSVPIPGPIWNWGAVRGFAARPGGGAYVLDLYGGVHTIGGAPTATGAPYWYGWGIARGIAVLPDGRGGYVLDGWGGLHPFGTATGIRGPYWHGWDIARDVVLLPSSTATRPAGYVLDAWGGLHPFGGAPAPTGAPYWHGRSLARDAIANPTGPGGWTLDGYGTMHPFAGAPTLTTTGRWNWDIARAATLWNTPAGLRGYVLDGYGGTHPINGAPRLTVTRYWNGKDIARHITINP